MKKNITAAIVAIAIMLLHTGFVFKPVAFTCAHTIPSTFYCGVGDQLKLVFDNISSPASGNVHLYDINDNYIGDPEIDVLSTNESGGHDIEFHLINEAGTDYHGVIYDVLCGSYSSASSYVICDY